jgi:hypothetical protein
MRATTGFRHQALGLTIGLTALALPGTGANAIDTIFHAITAQGTLTAVGESPPSSSVARAEVLINGTCNGQPLKLLWKSSSVPAP